MILITYWLNSFFEQPNSFNNLKRFNSLDRLAGHLADILKKCGNFMNICLVVKVKRLQRSCPPIAMCGGILLSSCLSVGWPFWIPVKCQNIWLGRAHNQLDCQDMSFKFHAVMIGVCAERCKMFIAKLVCCRILLRNVAVLVVLICVQSQLELMAENLSEMSFLGWPLKISD